MTICEWYVQGMSDLLSPILYVMEDESEAFWCFAALMARMAPNFNQDQNGMQAQLLALSKVYRAPSFWIMLLFLISVSKLYRSLYRWNSSSCLFYCSFSVSRCHWRLNSLFSCYLQLWGYLLQLVQLLDNPLHDYFKQNECLNYYFCFLCILICLKRWGLM